MESQSKHTKGTWIIPPDNNTLITCNGKQIGYCKSPADAILMCKSSSMHEILWQMRDILKDNPGIFGITGKAFLLTMDIVLDGIEPTE